jgi:hypothetical protein
MGDDAQNEKDRITGQREHERKRQDERGTTDVLRGTSDVLRGTTDVLRGTTDVLRGTTDVLRGTTDVLRGRGADAAADIFRAATGLGGHLIVAFVAPVSASSANTGCRPVDLTSPGAKLSAKADAVLANRPELMKESPKANNSDASNKPTPAAKKD